MRELPRNPSLDVVASARRRPWGAADVDMAAAAFFKCTRWQREETMDMINCPYYYFCDSTYPGDYPPAVDLLVLAVAAASYVSAVVFALMDGRKAEAEVPRGIGRRRITLLRKCLLPSGPLVLPILLVALANGHRIGAVFPLSALGPAVFQLILVSALAFENPAEMSLRYALLESSTVSGIMHASLHLDSVVLPYYTGLDALARSYLSGECPTCVCRREALVVGGRVVTYRGWSPAMFAVMGTLWSRLACALFRADKLSFVLKRALEGLAWILVAGDSAYLAVNSPRRDAMETAAQSAVCVFMSVCVLRRVYSALGCLPIFSAATGKEITTMVGDSSGSSISTCS